MVFADVTTTNVDFLGALTLGGTDATKINISKTGIITEIKGDAQVNGTTTLTGATTFGSGTPFTFPTADGTLNQVLQTNGSGTVTWVDAPNPFDQSLDQADSVVFADVTTTDVDFLGALTLGGTDATKINISKTGITTEIKGDAQVNGTTTLTGATTFGSGTPFTFPTADGTLNQVLQTNGSGTISWITSVNSASNVGTGEGVFKQKINNNIELRSLTPTSTKITLTDNENDIGIDVNQGNITGTGALTSGSINWTDTITTTGVLTGGDIIANGQGYSVLDTASLATTGDITIDFNDSNTFSVTLTGNADFKTITGGSLKAGSTYIFIINQGTGGFTLAYSNSAFKFPGGTVPTLSTGAGEVDILCGITDGTNIYMTLSNNFS